MMSASTIEQVFSACFQASHNTVLLGGGDEPYYAPAGPDKDCATIVYRQDYLASALHEVAHWCLAGPVRRQQVDYGYWYLGNRNAEQQRAFEAVEVKPQALERLFSEAIGLPFRPSFDYLRCPEYRGERFVARINEQYHQYRRSGLPERAACFVLALQTSLVSPAQAV